MENLQLQFAEFSQVNVNKTDAESCTAFRAVMSHECSLLSSQVLQNLGPTKYHLKLAFAKFVNYQSKEIDNIYSVVTEHCARACQNFSPEGEGKLA